MMGFGLGLWSLVGTFIFWVVLAVVAVWLVKLLFPSVSKSQNSKNVSLHSVGTRFKEPYESEK